MAGEWSPDSYREAGGKWATTYKIKNIVTNFNRALRLIPGSVFDRLKAE
jgi:hypothetical protein